MAIEYVYFDLGNVILNFDHRIGLSKLAAATGCSPQEIETIIFDSGLEDEFETGLIDANDFHQRFCCAAKAKISQSELMLACSDIFTLNSSIMPLIGQLAAVGFPIGILSNTCAAHWDFVFEKYSFLRQNFRDYVLSFEVKSMKPDGKIYAAAIDSAGFAADQIFFVDDRSENVQGASDAGLDANLFQTARQVTSELQDRGIRFNL